MSERKVGLQAGRPSDKKKAATLTDLAEKGNTVRVNFNLSREEHTKLKIYAAMTQKSIAEVLREFIASLRC